MKNVILIWFFLLINFCVVSQENISKNLLLEDYRTFISYLENTHPDPYSAFGGKIEFKRKVQNLSYQISDTTSIEQFIDLLNEFVSVLEDGHTSVNRMSTNQSSPNKKLPLNFRVATDGVFVNNSTKKLSYLIGSKLVKVNGVSIDSFAIDGSKIIPSENSYGRFRFAKYFLSNEKYAKKLITKFPFVEFDFELRNGKNRTVRIEYEEAPKWIKKTSILELNNENGLFYSQNIGYNSSIKYFIWQAMFSKEILSNLDNPQIKEYLISQTYKYTRRPANDSIALEGIPQLYVEFSNILTSMKRQGSDYLIIDLRFNSGGYTNLIRPLLYMLFGDKYLNYKSKAEYNRMLSNLLLKKHNVKTVYELLGDNETRYRLGDIEFDYFFKFSSNSIEEKRKDSTLISYNGTGYQFTKDLNGMPIHEPKIIVLTSPITFSAAFHFAYLLDEIGKTTIVGVPSGQAGNSFMENTPFKLPNTKLKGSISNAVQIFYPNNSQKGKVLMPDYPMNISHFAKYNYDENAEILYVLDLIKQGLIK